MRQKMRFYFAENNLGQAVRLIGYTYSPMSVPPVGVHDNCPYVDAIDEIEAFQLFRAGKYHLYKSPAPYPWNSKTGVEDTAIGDFQPTRIIR